MSRPRRLTSAEDFARVRELGDAYRSAGFILRVLRSTTPEGRIGMIVPRHGHTAVARNQVKRRLREIVRAEQLPQAVDLVITARPAAYTLTFDQLRASTQDLLARVPRGLD